MIVKYKNIFKDYLDYSIKKLEKKNCNFIYSTDEEKAFFSDGYIGAIVPKSYSPFADNDNSLDYKKMLYKYQDKQVYISNKREILGGIECYVLVDEFNTDITYINKKMLDKWFDSDRIQLYMQNLDNKTPVFIWYSDEIVGLILPIRKVV